MMKRNRQTIKFCNLAMKRCNNICSRSLPTEIKTGSKKRKKKKKRLINYRHYFLTYCVKNQSTLSQANVHTRTQCVTHSRTVKVILIKSFICMNRLQQKSRLTANVKRNREASFFFFFLPGAGSCCVLLSNHGKRSVSIRSLRC